MVSALCLLKYQVLIGFVIHGHSLVVCSICDQNMNICNSFLVHI